MLCTQFRVIEVKAVIICVCFGKVKYQYKCCLPTGELLNMVRVHALCLNNKTPISMSC